MSFAALLSSDAPNCLAYLLALCAPGAQQSHLATIKLVPPPVGGPDSGRILAYNTVTAGLASRQQNYFYLHFCWYTHFCGDTVMLRVRLLQHSSSPVTVRSVITHQVRREFIMKHYCLTGVLF